MDYLIYFLTGISGGIVAGLLGVGGGTIIIPLLLYLTGLDVKVATAISMIHILFASVSGTIFNYIHKTIIFKYSIYFGLSSVIFSFAGSYLSKYIPDVAMKICYLAVLSISFTMMFLKTRIHGTADTIKGKNLLFYRIIPVGAIAGFLGGMLGVGGGFLYVPSLMLFLNLPITIATGTSLGAIIFTSIPGIIGKIMTVDFNILFGVIVGTGGIAGSWLGTYLKRKIKPDIIRTIFILFFIAVFIRVIIDIISYYKNF